MLKVLLIDDEPIIREGLRKTIAWDRLGCMVAGEAENGMEAVERIKDLQPDILLTDIMMPGLNGLDLTRYVRENHPHMKIIFLTGYNDFSFAQQAVKLGAFDFVLKPTNTNELEAILKNARDQILENNSELSKQQEMRRMLEESLPVLKDKFISDLLHSNIYSIDDIRKKMKFFGLHFEGYILMCVEIDRFSDLKTKYSEEENYYFMLSLKEKISYLLECCKLRYIINCNQFVFTVILNFGTDSGEDMLKSSIVSLAAELKNKVEEQFPFTISIGISRFHKEIDHFRLAQKEVAACLENRFYIGGNSIIHIDDIFIYEGNQGQAGVETHGLLDAIRTGNTEKIVQEMKAITDALSRNSNKTYVRNICSEIIVSCTRLYCEIYGSAEDIFGDGIIPYEKIMNSPTAFELFEILMDMSANIAKYISELRTSQTRKVVSKAIEYLNRNYSKEITLNDLAEYVYMSPWYFSKLFKKECGETFTEYLLNIRIENARTLLKENIELKTYEIAEKVGFNDARYFSQIFKKVTGVTPTEYRESL